MPSVPVAGGVEISVGKIACLLRNYRAHAAEMKSAPPKEPYFFLKPATSIIGNGGTVLIPKMSQNVHHEVEMAVVIGERGSHLPKSAAMGCVAGYAIIIDVTARDIQDAAKREGRPWAIAKGFDTFAPMSSMVPKSSVPNPHDRDIWLDVNGERRQRGNTAQMIFDIPSIIEYVSSIMTLEPGDIIATGTPDGVGPLVAGDEVEAGIAGLGTLKVRVAGAP